MKGLTAVCHWWKTLSTAALDAGTLNARRYSLPKVLYWCQNGKHSSLSGSSISRYFLICWECEKVGYSVLV